MRLDLYFTRSNLSFANATSSRDRLNSIAHIHELQEKLPAIKRQIEDIEAAQLPVVPLPIETDRARVRVDYDYALRHYLD